jgi:hypothetical protein
MIKEKAAKGKTNRRGGRCERKTNNDKSFGSQELFKTLKEVKN